MIDAKFSTGMHAVVRPHLYTDDDPVVVRLIGQLVASVGRRPLLVVDVREVQCTCGNDNHTDTCMTRTARHRQHIQLQGVRGSIGQRFSHLSGILFEPVAMPLWPANESQLAA